ncbi:type II toxin-antitoxin system HicB family antitoxin [uncultured Limosilactobacillus sp.]|uniref:type II toxin-antitoxin system HicB family antitoxin n=1 Tax=uncultured Limosilactobacillus sp. TaxID=2837629 RepID=UPI0025E68B06|nr:type II toxin-antitoxin system HicB family antitoxin [uncultured Limosilactobacillus sp.]
MNEVTYPAVITKTQQGLRVDFPDLPDAFAHGENKQAAISNAQLALAMVIIDRQTHYEEVPTPSPLAQVAANHPEGQVNEITVDLDQY